MSGPEASFSQRSTRSAKSICHRQAAHDARAKWEEEASVVPSFADLSDRASLPKPVQCMTQFFRQCISAFSLEKTQDRERPVRQKLSLRHITGTSRRRVSRVPAEEPKRISVEVFCTSISSSDNPHRKVSFRWLNVAENVSKQDASTFALERKPAIALPMVCLEGASARPSDKTSKGWEIIKSGMDYILGRSISPATKQKISESPYSARKDVFPSPCKTLQCRRHSLDSKDASASSSALIASTGTMFLPPRIQPGEDVVLAQETKRVARPHLLFKRDAVAGALAGMCVSLCLHPVDTVKTVIQAQSSGQRLIFHTLLTIMSERGFLGLYRGLGSNLASSAPISAIYTFTYESVKAALIPHLPKEYHAIAHCTAGGCASIATSIVYTPSECVKQRMQVGSLYRNSWLTFLGILKNGGLSVLYSGWVAVLCRNVPQSVIKFYTYEGLKHYALGGQPNGTPLSTYQTLAFGGMAGSTAALFTTPFDVIKTRLQTQIPGSVMQQKSVFQAFQHIATSEGIGGLYRGLIPRLVIYVSQGALFFATYEFFRQVLAMEVKKFSVLNCGSTNVVCQGKVVEPT